MTRSDRVFRAMLLAYPEEHRRQYADPMAQLFRDRLARDGGGFGTARVWVHAGFDLAGSAFKERLETAMNVQTWTNRWWEAVVVIYAIAQVALGVVIANNLYPGWAVLIGFGPAVMLVGGLLLRERQRALATVMIIVASLVPCIFFWDVPVLARRGCHRWGAVERQDREGPSAGTRVRIASFLGADRGSRSRRLTERVGSR